MLRTLLLTTSALFAMARKRPWEPLLIMFAILLANAGLITVLLINEGATQGELLQREQGLLSNNIVVPADKATHFSKEQYALIRQSGFTQLIAFAERNIVLTCEDNEKKPVMLKLIGVDTQPFLGSTFKGLPQREVNRLQSMASQAASTSPRVNSNPRVFKSGRSPSFPVNGLIHPATSAKLSCHKVLSEVDKPPLWPASVTAVTTSAAPHNTLLIAIADFYKGEVRIANDAANHASREEPTSIQVPLAGFISFVSLTAEDIRHLEALLGTRVSVVGGDAINETGSLPESFRLNLWAMSALMGVVALFIVLNALNLMYRTRLPNIIRLRQLGVSTATLISALYVELFLYCIVSTPLGIVVGFQAASFLSPVISGTFASLFSAVFVNPDVNLLALFTLALTVTFSSLVLFALVPIKTLSNTLTLKRAKEGKSLPLVAVLVASVTAVMFLILIEKLIASTETALLLVALLLLFSCALVLLWLPILSKGLASMAPKKWPVFYYVIANMHLLSGKTRLAVCAFFIALTANIGMNTMTDSFRNATEQWLTQRLYSPYYLYTDLPLSKVTLPPSLSSTPLLKAQGEVLGVYPNSSKTIAANTPPSAVSISSYPAHQTGKNALVLDALAEPSLDAAWSKFVTGKGVFINQQLAFAHGIELGNTLRIENIKLRNSPSSASFAQTSSKPGALEEVSDIFSTTPTWKVLGIYPDYGNLNGQILVPLTYFSQDNDVIKNALFSGVMALYPANQDTGNSALFNGMAKQSTTPNTKVDDALSALTAKEGEYTLYAKQELLDISMQTFDRTFVLTDGLNITTLLVAGIAFAVSLTVLTLGSAAELSVLRALGVSQFKVKLALFMQYMLLCLLSALLAIPFGIYLAYVFINLVNRYAFNWVYPLAINTQVLFASVGVSLLIVSLVLLLPLGKLRPKIDLRQEAQL